MSRRPGTDALSPRAAFPGGASRALGTELRVAALAAGVAVLATTLTLVLGPVTLALPVVAWVAYLLVRSPPVLLALFVFVPYFESAPGIRAIPFDPTAALAVLLLLAIGLHLLEGRPVRRPPAALVVALGVIGVSLVIGLLWSADLVYGREKTLKFFTVTLLAALSPFVLLTREQDLRRFLYTIAAAAIVVAVLTPIVPPTVAEGIATEYDTQGRFSFGGQIFPARFLCTAALILFIVPGLTRNRWRLAAPVAALGLTYVAIGFGARGPIAAFLVTLAAVALLSALRSTRVLVGVLCAVVVGAVLLPFLTVPDSAGQRIRQAASDPVATLRGDTRWILYDQALDLIADNPVLGSGTGTFGSYVAVVSPPRQRLLYPHNIFLELWSEIGILPVLAFLGAVIGGTWALMRRLVVADEGRERQVLVLVLGLLIFNVLVTQVSGDLNDNRTALLAVGLAWMLGRRS